MENSRLNAFSVQTIQVVLTLILGIATISPDSTIRAGQALVADGRGVIVGGGVLMADGRGVIIGVSLTS